MHLDFFILLLQVDSLISFEERSVQSCLNNIGIFSKLTFSGGRKKLWGHHFELRIFRASMVGTNNFALGAIVKLKTSCGGWECAFWFF